MLDLLKVDQRDLAFQRIEQRDLDLLKDKQIALVLLRAIQRELHF